TPKTTPPCARWSQPISTQAGKPLLSSPLAPSSFSYLPLYHIYPTGPSTPFSSPFVPSLMHTSNQNRAYTHANQPYPTSSITLSPLPSRKHMPSRPVLAPPHSGSAAPKKRTASRHRSVDGDECVGLACFGDSERELFSAASVQEDVMGSATNADVLTTTPTASVSTGGAGASNGSGSGAGSAGGAIPTRGRRQAAW
ncbi:hypothetical protein CVT25_002151, partial [Psilocybe cyanescens]